GRVRLDVAVQLSGFGVQHASAAVCAIASGHARWWNTACELEWLPPYADRPLADVYHELWPAFVRIHGPLLVRGSVRLGEQLCDELGHALQRMACSPQTVVHGDFRADNLFFSDGGAVMIDWQLCSRGPRVFDGA